MMNDEVSMHLFMRVRLGADRDLMTNLHTTIVRSDESFILARFLGDIPEELSCRCWRSLAQVVQKECFAGNKSLKHALISNFEQGSVILYSPRMHEPVLYTGSVVSRPHFSSLMNVGVVSWAPCRDWIRILHKFTRINTCSHKYVHPQHTYF